MRTHLQKSGHRFTLNVKRKLKPSTKRVRGVFVAKSESHLL
jgi:hypothetical protein